MSDCGCGSVSCCVCKNPRPTARVVGVRTINGEIITDTWDLTNVEDCLIVLVRPVLDVITAPTNAHIVLGPVPAATPDGREKAIQFVYAVPAAWPAASYIDPTTNAIADTIIPYDMGFAMTTHDRSGTQPSWSVFS